VSFAVIFDLGGVVLDSPLRDRALERASASAAS
jgi:hypothetical protein